MGKEITAYVGLLRSDGSEPVEVTGYARAYIGEIDVWEIPDVLNKRDAAFNAVCSPGYGVIHDIAIFDCARGGIPMWVIQQEKKLEHHEGVIPFVHKTVLYRGMDVSAHIKASMTATQRFTI